MEEWNQKRIQAYIDNFVEESLTLDYKAADALERTDRKREQITKDVSAMANSDGGILIYGLKEYGDEARKHLAETIDPIDRTQFSKETLEQVIDNIRPLIPGLIIHPVQLNNSNEAAYVVEIPRSNTAHQAKDHRYYKRHNFISVPMEDYEVRDTMNRAAVPDAQADFGYTLNSNDNGREHHYGLLLKIKNLGNQVIEHFQLQFTFPQLDGNVSHIIHKREHIDIWPVTPREFIIRYRSDKVLFPQEEIDIGREMAVQYKIDTQIFTKFEIGYARGPIVKWTLYADNMPPKTGEKPFKELQCF